MGLMAEWKTVRASLLAKAFVVGSVEPSLAEVCDKVVPNWNPANGPVNQIESLILFITSPGGLILFGLVLVAGLFASRVLYGLTAVLGCFVIFGIYVNMTEENRVWEAAMREGCVTEPYLEGAVLVLLVFYSGYRTFRPLF